MTTEHRPPIKPGTARRLGLRHPASRPRLLVIAPGKLTDDEYEAFKARWLAAHRDETKAIYGPGGRPYLMPAIERAVRPRRRWPWHHPDREAWKP